MGKVSFHAVSIGALADVAGTFASELVIKELGGPGAYSAVFASGLAWSIVGGWTAASIAKREEVLHGLLSSYFCVALGIFGLIDGHGAMPLWMHVVGFTACPGLAAFGGSLRGFRRAAP